MVNITGYYMVFMMVKNNLLGGIPTPLKNMSSSIGMMKFPIYGKIKFMFQTTNQQQCTFRISYYVEGSVREP